MVNTTLHLYKQNFKFSSAHFLIFDATSAEKLHGHNYQVQVHLTVPESAEASARGFFIDFNIFKKWIKLRLDQWDERVLLPAQNSEVKILDKAPSLEVRFRDRFYVFPKNEVCLLAVTNTSVENLSRLLAEDIYQRFHTDGIREVRVQVEETAGQAASTVVTADSHSIPGNSL